MPRFDMLIKPCLYSLSKVDSTSLSSDVEDLCHATLVDCHLDQYR